MHRTEKKVAFYFVPLHRYVICSTTNAPYGIPCTREFVEEPAGKGHKNQVLHHSSSFPLQVIPLLHQPKTKSFSLASSGGNLDLSTLGTLLADVSLGLALASGGSGLGLLGLLGSSSLGLLLLALLDSLGTSGGSGLRAHGTALLDHIERGTNDGTLGLDGSASALLGDLL